MIIRLVVSNFKSYKGTQTIGPFHQFQAIIGPNGAGKSNLMDAISFVLLVDSRHLRSSNLRELIYRAEGSAKGASKAKAYVELVVQSDDDAKREIHFKRSIVPSSGTSEYAVDNKTIKREEYEKRLEELGVIVKARNFLVFQGDVESIASKSPKDFTTMIEQISGSDELKDEYDSLLSDKQKAEEDTIFNYQKKKGFNAEKKEYKAQKEEAEKFQNLMAKRDKIQKEHVLWQLFYIEKTMKDTLKSLVTSRKKRDELASFQAITEQQLSEKKQEQANISKDNARIERTIRQKRAEAQAKRPDEIKIAEEIHHITQRLTTNRTSLAKITQEYERHERDVESLTAELKEVQKASKQFEAEVAKQKTTDISLSDAQIADYNRRKEQVFGQTAPQQQKLAQLNRQQKQEVEYRNGLENKIKELETRKQQLQQTGEQLVERRNKMSAFVADNVAKMNELKQKLTDVTQSNKQASEAQAELTQDLENIQDKLREAKQDTKETERDRRFKEALESLKRLFPGVHGRLSDLCKYSHKKYNIALTVALGANMDSIIVDEERTAIECLKYLKEQRIGAATFIPLDTIKVKPIPEKLRMLGDHSKPVIDVIEFDQVYQKALLYAVGNTIVCDTLTEARKLGFGRERYKVVTLDGTLIHKSGLMTGGLSGIEARAGRWEEKEIEELKKKRQKILDSLAEVGRSLRQVDLEQQYRSQISGLESRIKYSKKDQTMTEEKIQRNDANVADVEKELKSIQPEFDKYDETIRARSEEIEEIEGEIFATEDKIFRDFCKAVGVSNIREYEGKQLKQVQEQSERRVKFAAQQSKLSTQLEYEKKRDLQTPKERMEKTIEEDESRLKELKQKEKEAKKVDESAEKEIEKLEKKSEELKNSMKEKDIEIRELKKALNSKTNEAASLQRHLTGEETQLEQFRNRRHTLLQKCKVEEISLPKIDGDTAMEEAEEEEDAMEVDTEGSSTVNSQAFREDDAMVAQLDFSDVKKKKDATNQKQYELINSTYIKEIQDTTAEIEKIAPNMKAIERFKSVQDQLKRTNDDFDAARKVAQDAAEKFTAVKTERFSRFMGAFTKISENIDQLYKDITRTVGSRAYLTLENLEEPYLEGIKYNAIPPNKRFRDMEQLSGGEKTVAALALLFSIHSYRPSPFFVLDEVDAALDPQNVSKVASYIKQRSKDMQFIVISLKDTFFEQADALIGIYKDQKENCTGTLTLDLAKYP